MLSNGSFLFNNNGRSFSMTTNLSTVCPEKLEEKISFKVTYDEVHGSSKFLMESDSVLLIMPNIPFRHPPINYSFQLFRPISY